MKKTFTPAVSCYTLKELIEQLNLLATEHPEVLDAPMSIHEGRNYIHGFRIKEFELSEQNSVYEAFFQTT